MQILGQPAKGIIDTRVESHLRSPSLELVDR